MKLPRKLSALLCGIGLTFFASTGQAAVIYFANNDLISSKTFSFEVHPYNQSLRDLTLELVAGAGLQIYLVREDGKRIWEELGIGAISTPLSFDLDAGLYSIKFVGLGKYIYSLTGPVTKIAAVPIPAVGWIFSSLMLALGLTARRRNGHSSASVSCQGQRYLPAPA